MYFLRCNSCGHLNEVKTEYLIFCSKCKKKIENNYSNWIKRNPGKSFEDYKKMVCTTQINEIQKSNSKSKKIKGLKYWIGFAIAFAIFYAIGQIGGEKIAGLIKKNPLYDKMLVETADEINRTCPIMIDNATRLDNTTALPDNAFQYNYTLVSMVKDSINIDELMNNLEPTVINYVKTNPDMKTIRDNNTTISYDYKDKYGVHLFKITIKPEQYK